MVVFGVSLCFFVLALAGMAAGAREVAGFSADRVRWFSAACIVLGILSLLV